MNNLDQIFIVKVFSEYRHCCGSLFRIKVVLCFVSVSERLLCFLSYLSAVVEDLLGWRLFITDACFLLVEAQLLGWLG